MFLLALFILQLQATRTRRASQFRQENGFQSFIDKLDSKNIL